MVSVTYAVLPPEQTIYQVVVTNRDARFEWRGEVDATGQATERLAPDGVRAALDAVMAYVSQYYRARTGTRHDLAGRASLPRRVGW